MLSLLLQGLILFLLAPACEASSLGLTVHAVPLDSDGGKTMRAHFTAIISSPCPSLSELCTEGEDCLVHATSLPFVGTKPMSGWCVRQWQKTVPSSYTGSIQLGNNTELYVSIKAEPIIRENSGRLNQPAFVALPPPLRARVNCPQNFHLSVKDLDGDRVRCRFAQPEQAECLNCTQHSFIELDKEKCKLTFTGEASAGQYSIYLMVEDLIPAPTRNPAIDNTPLSSVSVHLSLTVESTSSCTDKPVVLDETPKDNIALFVLPYQEVKFSVYFMSELESVSEIAVVGPPELFRTDFKSVGPLSSMTMVWIRSENTLARLLPICFAANTNSLQSEARCVWLYQREMRPLPTGTELTCETTEMTLVLPVASLININLNELQLNSPTCPITYNDTHVMARISLNGCGTKIVHSGSEMVYTNTLQSVRPYTMVSRMPSLVLPVACRIPGSQLEGPKYQLNMPTEKEVFGEVDFKIEFYFPGEGPLAKFTSLNRFRYIQRPEGRLRREAGSPIQRDIVSQSSSTSSTNSSSTDGNSTSSNSSRAIGSKIDQLDLHVSSNCSISRAQLIVGNCLESETEDFAETRPLLSQGCATSSTTLEVITSETNTKVYRLSLSDLESKGSMFYIQCTVNLCITTKTSDSCPDLCSRSLSSKVLVGSVFSKSYTVKSGPVSLVYTTPAPLIAGISTTAISTTTTSTATTAASVITSHAPEQASSMAGGVLLTIIVLLQNIFLN